MTDAAPLTLHFRRVLAAPRARVFRAHADPAQLARWWGPHGVTTPIVELDVRTGGRYRIEMQPPEGEPFHLSGEYLQVEPDRRLVYTFRWEEPTPDDRETTVTFALRDLGESTELTVEHGVFSTEARRAVHHQGWSDSLDRLEALLSGASSR